MFKSVVKSFFLIAGSTIAISCSSANNKPILIRFSADSTAVIFSGINPAGLLQVRNTPQIDTAYGAILSVLQTPSDNDPDGMEFPFPGKVKVTDSTVVFTPARPFVKGQEYLVVSYMNVKFGSPAMIFSGKLDRNVRPQQVILKR